MGNQRLNQGFIESKIADAGYKFISGVYQTCMSKLLVECNNHHQYYTTWNNFQQGYRCAICSGIKITDLESHTRELAEAIGFNFIEVHGTRNRKRNVQVRCSAGHVTMVSRQSLRLKHGCGVCNPQRQKTLSDVSYLVDTDTWDILDFAPRPGKTGRKMLHLRCKEHNQVVYAAPNNLRRGRHKGCQCCGSLPERELFRLFTSWNLKFESNTKMVIKKELDFWFPDLMVAVEFNGIWWHSTKHKRRQGSYHSEKWRQCKYLGIDLLSVWEHHWEKQRDAIISLLRARLNNPPDIGSILSIGKTLGLVDGEAVSNDLGVSLALKLSNMLPPSEFMVKYDGGEFTVCNSGWSSHSAAVDMGVG